MQKIGTVLKGFMKDKIKVLRTEHCKECGKDFNVIAYLNNNKETMFVAETCPYCEKEKEEEQLRREAIESRIRARISKAKRYSVIPYELEKVTFDDYKPENESQQTAYELSIKFAKGELDKTTLFFQGDTGLGKSHLSYCIHQKFINDKKPSIFIDLPSLLSEIRSTYSNGNDWRKRTQEDIMNAIKEVELLVLDDIGAEYVKPDANGYESWAADILFQIANSRQGKKNVYTTNFTSKLLTQKYGMMSKRIISRLMNNAKVIKIEGTDHRLKGLD
mgnify:FL=1